MKKTRVRKSRDRVALILPIPRELLTCDTTGNEECTLQEFLNHLAGPNEQNKSIHCYVTINAMANQRSV
jgi:hypothetical protein